MSVNVTFICVTSKIGELCHPGAPHWHGSRAEHPQYMGRQTLCRLDRHTALFHLRSLDQHKEGVLSINAVMSAIVCLLHSAVYVCCTMPCMCVVQCRVCVLYGAVYVLYSAVYMLCSAVYMLWSAM